MAKEKIWNGYTDDGLRVEAWARPGLGDLEIVIFAANYRVIIPADVIRDLVAKRLPTDDGRALLDLLLGEP